MAESKKTTVSQGAMFKIGQAMGPAAPIDYGKVLKSFTSGIDKMMATRKLKTEIGRSKTLDLLKKFPNGVELNKVPEELRPMLTDYLKKNKDEYANYAKIVAKGYTHTDYDVAVEAMNRIKTGVESMSKQFENITLTRKNVLDRSNTKNGIAKATTQLEQQNIDNIIHMDMDLLNPVIENNTLMFQNSQGDYVNAEEYSGGTGSEYSHKFGDKINDAKFAVQDLAKADGRGNKNTWNEDRARNDIEKLARDQDSVVSFLYEEGMVDDYVKQTTVVPGFGMTIAEFEEQMKDSGFVKAMEGFNELLPPGQTWKDVVYGNLEAVKEELKNPEHKEKLTNWFIENEMTTLRETYATSFEEGKNPVTSYEDWQNDY
jgi:hypothetical protein